MTVLPSSQSAELQTSQNLVTATWAAIALIIAILSISTASILIIYAQQELGSNAITFDRLGLAAIAFVLYRGSQGLRRSQFVAPEEPVRPQINDLALLLLAGTTFAGSLIVWAWSMTQTSVANATLLENILPLFTTLGGWLFLKQRFSRQFLVGMIVAIIGAIAIGLGDMQIEGNQLMGDGAAVLSAIFASASLLSVEQLRSKFSTLWIMGWTSLIGAVFAGILMVFTENQWFPQTSIGILAIVGLALISQCLGQGLLTFCLTHFTSAFVAVTLLIIPAIAAILAWILFAETLSLANILSFGVVLIGIYLATTAPIPGTVPLLSPVQD